MKIEKTTEVIAELARIMKDNKLSSLTIEDEEFNIILGAEFPQSVTAPPAQMMAAQSAPAQPAPAPVQPIIQQINGDVEVNTVPAGNVVKSPIVGIYYASPAPGKPAFTKVGATVKKGDVICIIESMKIMNEVTSDYDGTVRELYLKDGDAVEYESPIMRIE